MAHCLTCAAADAAVQHEKPDPGERVALIYHVYELAHAAISPIRMGAHVLRLQLESPMHPLAQLPLAKSIAAGCQVFENLTRRYGKPEWGIDSVGMDGVDVPVADATVWHRPFCNLVHFERDESAGEPRRLPKLLIVAPMSGHYATLLRGTVRAMLPEHDVYITDWRDARVVPLLEGRFDLDDFIDYVIDMIRFLGPDTHVMAVCQPSVPVLAACAVMAAANDPCQPASMILMGGPIDTRRNPSAVNELVATKPLSWFESTVLSYVPFPNPGMMRKVYPGFVQLSGFMTMNLDRHHVAHIDLYNNLIKGDCDSVRAHNQFYDEYLAVMDLPGEFYLQTVETVFQSHALPNGTFMHRGSRVDCKAIRNTALMTVEGEKDDICGIGQTQAAHDLCRSIPAGARFHHVQEGVGHFGVFNGTRFRAEIQPRIRDMIRAVELKRRTGAATVSVDATSSV
jgi:poly(3-hydroxybutyrate) depolymerase